MNNALETCEVASSVTTIMATPEVEEKKRKNNV